jgi:transcription antitermination factor NusG
MLGIQNNPQFISPVPVARPAVDEPLWYAVHTMARHEKRVVKHFQEKQVYTFLPLIERVHRWSDRLKRVDLPLFSCYTFVRIPPTAENRVKVLRTPGVIGFVGSEGQGTSIREEEIESLQTALRQRVPCIDHPFLATGKRVRIRGGCLDGIEGIFEGHGADQKLIISVELLQRSLSIRVDGYEIDVI